MRVGLVNGEADRCAFFLNFDNRKEIRSFQAGYKSYLHLNILSMGKHPQKSPIGRRRAWLMPLFFSLVLSVLCGSVVAQQHPHYTMYMANNFVLNPAIAGIEPYIDMKLAARSQWTGINEAPKTMYVTVNAPVDITNFHRNRIGVGGKVFVDKTGPIMLSAAELNFAYHLPLNSEYKLSFGTGVGVTHHRVDAGGLRLEDPLDPILSSERLSRTAPLINAGLWFYGRDMFAGLAAQNLIESDYSLHNAAPGTGMGLRRHYFLTAGYRFRFGDFYLTPSAMMKFVSPAPMGYDINLKGQFSDRFWAGLTWRHQDGMAAMIGLFMTSSLNLAYSYDFLNSELRQHSFGTHEIVVGINISNQWGPRCPTIAW